MRKWIWLKNILIYALILTIAILTARLYKIRKTEIINTATYTDYFQTGESLNGGLEIVLESFTTFKREYDFAEKPIEKRVEMIEYKVVSGDNFQKIADEFGISVDTLKIYNKSTRTGKLKAGETLTLPSYNGIFYKIRKNDTVSKIAKLYGINSEDIIEFNNLDPKKLIAGKKIFLRDVSFKKFMEIENAAKAVEEKKKKASSSTGGGKVQDIDTSGDSGSGGFAYPVKFNGVASKFGNRYHPVLKKYILHTGVDLVAKYVPLRASKDGTVSFAGYMNGYGKIIIIKHSGGFETRYAHLSVISTKVGEQVKKGDLIGKTGASGRVTGPHLHFEIRKNGTPLNPMKYL